MKRVFVFIVSLYCLYGTLAFAGPKLFTDDDLGKYQSEDDSYPPPAITPKNEVQDTDKARAYGLCTEIIKGKLKTPSVAKFNTAVGGHVRPDESVIYENGYYEVIGTVDSQNSYGAMLRGSFYCKLYKDAAGSWHVKEAYTVK
jgi:hypothetical protein